MKRILLAISLVSFAAQTPMYATESKVLAMLIKPEHKQVLAEVGGAIAADARLLAKQSGQIAKCALTGAETALCMPFIALSCGTKGIAAGLAYLDNNHPLVGAALFAGISAQSFKKCNEYDRNNNNEKAFLCFLSGAGSALAATAYGVAAIHKYCN